MRVLTGSTDLGNLALRDVGSAPAPESHWHSGGCVDGLEDVVLRLSGHAAQRMKGCGARASLREVGNHQPIRPPFKHLYLGICTEGPFKSLVQKKNNDSESTDYYHRYEDKYTKYFLISINPQDNRLQHTSDR